MLGKAAYAWSHTSERASIRNAYVKTIQVINVAGWLQNSVQPEWTFLLPLSLVWLSHAVIYCLSLGCLMVDANWPPFPLSSAQMKRFPPSCDGACHNLIRQIKKLTAVTLSSFEAVASSAIMIIFLHWNHRSALPNTILKRASCCSRAVCVTSLNCCDL